MDDALYLEVSGNSFAFVFDGKAYIARQLQRLYVCRHDSSYTHYGDFQWYENITASVDELTIRYSVYDPTALLTLGWQEVRQIHPVVYLCHNLLGLFRFLCHVCPWYAQ